MAQPVPTHMMATTVTTTPVTLMSHPAQRKAKDFLIFSLILMMLCFLHGNILNGLLTSPALICSLAVCVLNNDTISIVTVATLVKSMLNTKHTIIKYSCYLIGFDKYSQRL